MNARDDSAAEGAVRQSRAAVLSLNAGSSSLKFALYPVVDGQADSACFSGLAEGLEPGGHAQLTWGDPAHGAQRISLPAVPGAGGFEAALQGVMQLVARHATQRIVAIAHRVVHGGDRFSTSVRIDDEVLRYLESLSPLAPLHQPHNLEGVKACLKAFPELPQVACFDTAFHATAPELAQRFALPEALWQAGVRRYGFHGLSYDHVTRQLLTLSQAAKGRMILAHLGNGASLCAVHGGRSVGSSMGFSALDGLMMGTRCGTLDVGVVLHLLRQGYDLPKLEALLYKQSGLLGVSGLSADVRSLRASDQASAQRALSMFAYRVIRECGALTACLGGLELIGFTGGIGEHDALMREAVAEGLAHLGVRLDVQANRAAQGQTAQPVHAADSRVEVWVVPTDEGRVAARDALQALRPTAPGPQLDPAAPAGTGPAASGQPTQVMMV